MQGLPYVLNQNPVGRSKWSSAVIRLTDRNVCVYFDGDLQVVRRSCMSFMTKQNKLYFLLSATQLGII